jgi:hypothetical protein
MPETDTERQLRSVVESLTRVETLLKKLQKKGEGPLRWITLVATIISTIVIAGLTALTTYRFAQQNQILQAAAAAQNQIHDLSSEQENTRYGAELYLAKTQYADLVVRQAVEFGDAEILKVLEADTSIDPGERAKFKDAEESLLKLVEPDKACYDGTWRENKSKIRDHTIKIIGPKRLLLYRGGDDGGFWLEARKIGKNFWFAPDFSWGGEHTGSVRLVTSDDCSTMDSNWNWHYEKLVPGSSPNKSKSKTPEELLNDLRNQQGTSNGRNRRSPRLLARSS